MSSRAVLHQVGIGVGVRGWTQVTALAVMLFAGRVLEREQFGVYAIASVFIVLLSTMIYSGLYEFMIKAEALERVADTCFWMNLGLASCGALLIVGIAPIVAHLSHAPAVARLMMLLAPSALVSAINSWQEALLLRANRVAANYMIWFVAETAAAAFAVFLLLHGAGLLSLIGYRYGQAVMMTLGYSLHRPRWPRLHWSRQVAAEALHFASNLYVSRFVGILVNYSADLIIGILVGPAAAGVYRLGSRMVFGISEICYQPLRTIAWVRFTRAVRGGRGLDAEWIGLMQILSFVTWPALAVTAVLAQPMVVTLLGARWAEAGPVVVILAASRAAAMFEIFLDPLLGSIGRPRRLLVIRCGAAAIAITSLLLLGRHGVAAAAWSQVLTLGCVAVITAAIGIHITAVPPWTIARVLAPGAATAACAAVAALLGASWISAWHPAAPYRLLGGLLTSVLVWALLAGSVFRTTIIGIVHRLREQAPALAPSR